MDVMRQLTGELVCNYQHYIKRKSIMKFKYKITKQILDSVCGTVAFILCIPIYIIIGIAIKMTVDGHVFYKQERIR